MKPEDPNVQAWLEPELEARLVASLLGEASAFEQAELDRLLKERPEIAVFQRRLQAVHGLVDEAVKQGPDDDWKLSKDKRTKVLETIRGTASQDETPSNVIAQKQSKRQWIGIAAAASVALFAGAVAMVNTMTGLQSSDSADIAMTREREDYGVEPNVDAKIASAAKESFGDLAQVDNYAYQVSTTPSKPRYFQTENTGVTLKVAPQVGPDGYTIDMDLVPEVVEFDGFAIYEPKIAATKPQSTSDDLAKLGDLENSAAGEALAYHESQEEQLGELDQAEQRFYEVLRDDKFNSAARQGIERVERDRSRHLSAAYDQTRAELIDKVDEAWETPAPKASAATDEEKKAQPQAPELLARSSREAESKEALGLINQEALTDNLTAYAVTPATGDDPPELAQEFGTTQSRSDAPEINVHGRPRIDAFKTTPEIITRSGSTAKVEVVRELIYPDEFDAAKLPQEVVATDGAVAFPVTPPTPTHWKWSFESDESKPSASNTPNLAQAQEQPDQLSYFATQDTEWAESGSTESLNWASQPGMIRTYPPANDSDRQDAPSIESTQVGGALTRFENIADYVTFEFSDPDSKSLAENKSEPYAELAPDNEASFGLIAGFNLIDRNLKRDEAATEEFLENDPEAISPAPGVFAVAGVLTDPQFQTVLQSDAMKKWTGSRGGSEVEGLAKGLRSSSESIVDNNLDALITTLETAPLIAPEKVVALAIASPKSPEQVALTQQSIKVEEARLRMLDFAERYRAIDLAAMQNRASETGEPLQEEESVQHSSQEKEKEKEQRYAKAKKDYEAEKQNLRGFEEGRLSEALVQKDFKTRETILQQQLDKVAAQEAQVAMLGTRYDIPTVLKRQNETAGSDSLSLAEFETKKDTAMDDRRKLEEYKEAQQELGFRRKLVEKVKRALEPAKSQSLNEKHTKQEPFSTFSLHVSDVAFKLAKAALLEQNKWPEVAKVRIEEFVNAFDYGDPAPTQSEKVSCQVEQAAHPFRQQRNVLRVAMRTAEMGRSSGTPLQITLLLDTSGSMERADRQESISQAMKVLTSQLTPSDTVTLIGFARQPRLIQDRLTGDALANLPKFVKQTPSEGGTNLEEALLLGAEHARRQFVEAGQNRIVLITDGAANLGDADAESLRDLVVGLRQEGIAFDACGVGAEGLNDTVLEALTRDGDGRYYLLNKPEDANAGFARQLAGAFRPAARNVKVQVRFNDRRVGNYRLLGFEKHRLKKEDFRNDKVDAAEMASSETGVAVYEIEPLPQGDGEIGEVSVRFQDMTTGRMVERTWPIAYNANVPALDEASPSLQLASTAAFLGEKLKGSTFGKAINLEELSQVLTNLRQHYSSDPRIASLIAMIEKVKEQQP